MSPSETSSRDGYLEHPDEAFAYFRSQGVPQVVCEEKHMGSRAVVVICRDEEAARKRFGVEGESGIIITRTGRRFFNDAELESALLDRVRTALTASELLGGVQHELGGARLRTDAVVRQGPGTAEVAIRGRWIGRKCRPAGCG